MGRRELIAERLKVLKTKRLPADPRPEWSIDGKLPRMNLTPINYRTAGPVCTRSPSAYGSKK